jgi:uncharacterized membrane protein YbhN (UPF0104 family)
MAHGLNDTREPETNAKSRSAVSLEAVIGYVIVAVFLLLCGRYVFVHREDFSFIATVSLPDVVLAGLLIVLSFLISAYQFGLFLKNFGLSVRPLELTALTMAMCLGNLLTPMRGGTGGLAIYLKRVHGLDFRSFAVIYGGTALLIALINTGLALVCLALLWLSRGFFHPGLSLFVVVLFACCLYLSLFPPPLRWKRSGILGLIFDAAHSWHLLTRDRGLLLRLTISFLLVAFALAGSFYFIYVGLGTPVSGLGVIITSGLGNIANLVGLTPGSLGIFDAVVIEVPQFFGLDPARSITGALVFRALSFFWALLLGIPGLLYVLGLTRRARKRKLNKA